MNSSEPDRPSYSKEDVSEDIEEQRTRRSLQGTFVGAVPTMQEIVGWVYNAVLTGVAYRIYDGQWSCIIKADFGARPMVAYVNGRSFAHCVDNSCEVAEAKVLTWYPDRYPPKERRTRASLR